MPSQPKKDIQASAPAVPRPLASAGVDRRRLVSAGCAGAAGLLATSDRVIGPALGLVLWGACLALILVGLSGLGASRASTRVLRLVAIVLVGWLWVATSPRADVWITDVKLASMMDGALGADVSFENRGPTSAIVTKKTKLSLFPSREFADGETRRKREREAVDTFFDDGDGVAGPTEVLP